LPEFVTISEAARALGVDARQVRRWVDRLEPKDKGQDTQRTHKGQPIVTVRLSAVEALQKGDSRGEAPKDTTKGQARDTGPRPVRVSDEMSLRLSEAEKRASALEVRAAVAEARAELLEAERDRLDKSLTEALAIARAAQDAERSARLIGSREIRQVEGFEERFEPSSGDSPAMQEDKPRPWWAFLRRR